MLEHQQNGLGKTLCCIDVESIIKSDNRNAEIDQDMVKLQKVDFGL
jgi:hypothetical protein